MHSLRELLYSYEFAGEWLDRRSPQARNYIVVFDGGHGSAGEGGWTGHGPETVA